MSQPIVSGNGSESSPFLYTGSDKLEFVLAMADAVDATNPLQVGKKFIIILKRKSENCFLA